MLLACLVFVEGAGQLGLNSCYGDGYATNPQLLQSAGASDPTPFFKALAHKPYALQVALAPHVYGPAVTHAVNATAGTGLWQRLSNSFGYLTETGFCTGSTCRRFPVAIGEFGSTFLDPRDVATLTDLSLYLRNQGAAADGHHAAIPIGFGGLTMPTAATLAAWSKTTG